MLLAYDLVWVSSNTEPSILGVILKQSQSDAQFYEVLLVSGDLVVIHEYFLTLA